MNLVILLIGVLLGFWLVGALLDNRKKTPPKAEPRHSQEKEEPSPPPQAQDPVEQACQVLNLGRPFTAGELRAAYRQRMSLYHPDKVDALGPELRELAEHKTKEINVAFDFLQGHARS